METYAKDQVLRYFLVPRFKVPKLELVIPVLISGARFEQLIRFNMRRQKFLVYVFGHINEVVGSIQISSSENIRHHRCLVCFLEYVKQIIGLERMASSEFFKPRTNPVTYVLNPNISKDMAAEGTVIERMVSDFWEQLQTNPDPSQPSNVVRQMWTRIFEQALTEQNLVDAYKKSNPNNELLKQSLIEILKTVITNTVIDSTTIQSLLVNPETNIVKNGSSDSSVFTIKAEILEEGFFIREIKDDETGQTRPVEFE